jgi:aspartyl-tRNA(Asn)/glutamyl-tRNA(Gln) amidotransferase subunit A
MPTTFGEAFDVNSKKDPVAMYAEDMFTIISNLVGVPAINIPYSTGKNGLPLGVQIIGKKFDEQTVFDISSYIHKNYKESK